MNLKTFGSFGLATAAFLSAFGITALMVAVTVRICRRHGWVAKPRGDRWHTGTPAMFGGLPLWLGFVGACAFFLPYSSRLAWQLVGLSSMICALGLVDDLWHLTPRSKFLLQLLTAALALSCGVIYPLRENLIVNLLVSIVWIVGITNAFNLLDNMDGLSAGIALIVSLYLFVFYVSSGSRDYPTLVAAAAGAIAGFLIFNFYPAKIFMGDSGSLFLGFLLGTVSLVQVTHISGVSTLVLAPIAVLAIPIFDTFFVSVTRRLRGQPVSVGGTDHSSHRLVNLGLSERNAVLLLYTLAAASGIIALLTRKLIYPDAIGLVCFLYLLLLLFGIHLFRGDNTNASAELSHSRSWARLRERDTLAFLLDPLVLSLSYYLAYFLRFRVSVPPVEVALFLRSWPIVLALKFGFLYICKTYQHSWWRGSRGDSLRLACGVILGEVASVLVLTGVYRFNGYSRLVFLVDCIISWIFLFGLRRSFFVFRASVKAWESEKPAARRVFVLGTSEHAEFVLRFLRVQRIECAGLIDTNGGSDLNRSVWGTPVIGRLDNLTELAMRYGVSELILPENETLPCSEAAFHDQCTADKLRLMKLGLYLTNSEWAGEARHFILKRSASGH
jgi:UDP-GlcNAc:undecaprenyl-phosphate GlcNAc-1-phosphate transferase